MKIIDVHAHIFPDDLALKAVPFMAEEAGIKEALDGRCQSLIGSMDESGIAESWLQPVATKPSQIPTINVFTESVRSERLVTFGAVHPGYEDLPGLIEDLASRGFHGVKVHPEYHKTSPRDERYYPMYEALQDCGMIVLFHAGYDIGIPTINSFPADFALLRDRFPQLRMILAHMGGFRQWKDVSADLAGTDVFLDTSYSLGHMPDEEFVELVHKHGAERILFGTDSPWADQRQELDHMKSLPLSPSELEMILGGNAERLLNEVRQSIPRA